MTKEAKTQVKVQVGIEALWKALAKDLRFVIPNIMPEFIKDVAIIEGDGGPGTVFLFKFDSEVTSMRYQKEKLVDFDEAVHQVGLEVVEGGHLDMGFSSYKTIFQLTADGELETLINVKVVYDTEGQVHGAQEKTLKAWQTFIERLENYLLNRGN